MSDTHRENAVLLAILIIVNKKLSQASFDKTIKAIIKERKEKTTGEYVVKYQDSTFSAYATNSDIYYENGTEVYILIPGNDWSRVKTIIGTTKQQATVYKEVLLSEELYNRLGNNAVKGFGSMELCSYRDSIIDAPINLPINEENLGYIKQGDGLAIGMMVRTAFDSGQVGGQYGAIFNLTFLDALGYAATRPYIVSSKDVIGNPYALTAETYVEAVIKDIDIDKFTGVESVQLFDEGFPNQKEGMPNDIFITGLYMYGAKVLTEKNALDYTVHIDYSSGGNIIDSKEIVLFTAQLKINGRTVNSDVEYYWCILNGLVFRSNSSDKYFSKAGDGWECLNPYFSKKPIPYNTNKFYFYKEGLTELELKDRLEREYGQAAVQDYTKAAAVPQKVTKVKCVVVYDNNTFSGEAKVINKNIHLVAIDSSDKIDNENKTIYYLDNGSPTLTCSIVDGNLAEDESYAYTWSVTPLHGLSFIVELKLEYNHYLNVILPKWEKVQAKYEQYDEEGQNRYILSSEYKDTKRAYDEAVASFEKEFIVKNNQFIKFPISSISGSSTISCAIEKVKGLERTYIGTGSISLENRLLIEGLYSLSIENGTQVFQYDNKGNSPTSGQLEKPLEIKPLTFNLIDNTGNNIPYEQIINNGYIKWLVPKSNTLLIIQALPKTLNLTIEDIRFNELGYDVYLNLKELPYTIANNYDRKNNNNDIRLNIKYKYMLFDAYTDFNFPKNGDPGTNGTDYVAKIVPTVSSDRVYVSSGGTLFNDQGYNVQLKAELYNNSNIISYSNLNSPELWSCPPKEDAKNNNITYLTIPSMTLGKLQINIDGKYFSYLPTSEEDLWLTIKNKLLTDLPTNIVRVKYKRQKALDSEFLNYYAEYPVCYNYILSGNNNYRIKIVPKTGFKYVVYASDGTSPNYDSTLPFKIRLERKENNANFFKDVTTLLLDSNAYLYLWMTIGNLEIEGDNTGITCRVKPKNTFDGLHLSSAVVCKITYANIFIGFIHIPIYMYLNRYNNQALNDWDGNSILLNANGDTILAPQVGAGKKDNDTNTFTGVVMGEVKESNATHATQIGLVGYHQGVRSIFLDAETGKAEFGKNGSGKILVDPSLKINGEEAGVLYSKRYVLPEKDSKGNINLDVSTYHPGEGMIVDLSTPQIGFGSGDFSVDKNGHLIAKGGGSIAGWNITDNRLYKNNTGISSSDYKASLIGASLPSSDSTIAFYAGTNNEKNNFYVTHDGYLFSKSGQIAGWDITPYQLNKGTTVGINSINTPNSTGSITVSVPTSADGKSKANHTKAFYANGDNFYVTHQGFLKSNMGRIGNWHISTTGLSNTDSAGNTLTLSPTSGINLASKDGKSRFSATAKGTIYSNSGTIGGWSIDNATLTGTDSNGNKITINSNGSISSSTKNWGINANGSVTFKNGYIGGVQITSSGIQDATTHGSVWHINGTDVYFKGLKVTEKNNYYVTTSGASGGISNGSGTYSLGSNGLYSDPTKTYADKEGGTNYKDYFDLLAAERLMVGLSGSNRTETSELTVYPGHSGSAKGKNLKFTGSPLFSVLKNGGVTIGSGAKTFSMNPATTKISIGGNIGLNATVSFSDGSYLKFANGICYEGKYQKGGKWTTVKGKQ